MVNLKVTLGTVNYTDFLHVTASKVSSPDVIAWEDWIDVPVTNYNFVIPGLDPENYYIRYYDAATNIALGTLRAELIVNALTSEFIYERRFYTCGGSSTGDPASGSASITDPYLIGKNVTGVFKEAFRYFIPDVEFSFNDVTGVVSVINGTTFSTAEVFSVDIEYAVASTGAGVATYIGNLNITEATRTLLLSEVNKRCRLLGTAPTQVITVPALSTLASDNGYYFDNSVGGTAVQVKILTNGTDRILFNGFNTASNEFAEFWVSKGEHLLIRKYSDTYWEVIGDYKGTSVGEKVTVGFKNHPNILPEDGSEVDGEQYPRLYWWITNVLTASHWISDDTGTQVPSRIGQFIIKPSTKKILMPNTQSLSERALADFNSYGSDTANRPYDFPGGYQDEMLLAHGHTISTTDSDPSLSDGADPVRGTITGSVNGRGAAAADGETKSIGRTGGTEQRLKNTGVIFGRRI